MASSTSFRLREEVKARLVEHAEREGVSVTTLLEQLIVEGTDTRDHPGITFRGPGHDRRAALAGGPDVWEVVARLRELDGAEEDRIEALAAESALHPRQVRAALEFAARHGDDVDRRIGRHERAVRDSQVAAERRRAYLT
jgi:hypothetical protein